MAAAATLLATVSLLAGSTSIGSFGTRDADAAPSPAAQGGKGPVAGVVDAFTGTVNGVAAQNALYAFVSAHERRLVRLTLTVRAPRTVQLTREPKTVVLDTGCGATPTQSNGCPAVLDAAGVTYLFSGVGPATATDMTMSASGLSINGYFSVSPSTRDLAGGVTVGLHAVVYGGLPETEDDD